MPNQRTSRAQLAETLNRPGDLPGDLVAPLPGHLERDLPELKQWLDQALASNPTLVALRAEAEAARELGWEHIDAVVVGTPDHWHCLNMVDSVAAGKDVYVEKPVSHTLLEGRKMVEAARKYQRVVQTGTQSRSTPTPA